MRQIQLPEDFPEVITLCGSTNFKQQFLEVQKGLSLEGKIVISVSMFGHADNEPITPEQKIALDQLHFRKIDLSDMIYVIDVEGYIGESTRNEITYAGKTGKKIRYYSDDEY
jgi:hypothetical protein